MYERYRRFKNTSALMAADVEGSIEDDDFDYELWLALCEVIDEPSDALRYKEPVWVYYASRLMEWEVGNGGFSQAAYNIPDWFQLASAAYSKLGLIDAANLIDQALDMVVGGENRNTKFTAEEIGDLFSQFSSSKLCELDEKLDESGWWATSEWLKVVRDNRKYFDIDA